MFEKVHFHEWELIVDKQSTINAYAEVEYGGSRSCSCGDCMEYTRRIDSIFPGNVKLLFESLGIDYHKDAEVIHIISDNNHNYCSGWFHFIGEFKGKSCAVPMTDTGYTLQLTDIADNFKIGFHVGDSFALFKSPYPLVQLEFSTLIPHWSEHSAQTPPRPRL